MKKLCLGKKRPSEMTGRKNGIFGHWEDAQGWNSGCVIINE
jgi:hypothetical protein